MPIDVVESRLRRLRLLAVANGLRPAKPDWSHVGMALMALGAPLAWTPDPTALLDVLLLAAAACASLAAVADGFGAPIRQPIFKRLDFWFAFASLAALATMAPDVAVCLLATAGADIAARRRPPHPSFALIWSIAGALAGATIRMHAGALALDADLSHVHTLCVALGALYALALHPSGVDIAKALKPPSQGRKPGLPAAPGGAWLIPARAWLFCLTLGAYAAAATIPRGGVELAAIASAPLFLWAMAAAWRDAPSPTRLVTYAPKYRPALLFALWFALTTLIAAAH